MSTMYYTMPEHEPIGQVHSLGKDKGFHFTWCMLPLKVLDYALTAARGDKHVITEYGDTMSFTTFRDMVNNAQSQSLDERIE